MRAIAAASLVIAFACGRGSAAQDPASLEASASGPVQAGAAIGITARVMRGSVAAAGVAVTFDAPAQIALSRATVQADSAGIAQTSASSAVAGTFTVRATAAGGSATVDVQFLAAPAAALRFISTPSQAVAGEPFEVVVAAENASGNQADAPDVALSIVPGPASARLTLISRTLDGGRAAFTASIDREAIGVFLTASSGSLSARSPPIDVRATHELASWQQVGPEGAPDVRVARSPADPRTLVAWSPAWVTLARSRDQLFISRDAGVSWAPAGADGVPTQPFRLWESMAWCSDGSLYLDVFDSGVYRSRDQGRTFQSLGGKAGFIYCDGADKPFLLQTTGTTTLLRWNGSAFVPASNLLLFSVSAAPDGSFFAVEGEAVVRSIDGGLTWERTAYPGRAALVVALSTDVALVFGHDLAIDRTGDGGATWTRVLPPEVGVVNIDRAPDGSLAAIDGSGTIHRSVDAGATWTTFQGDAPQQPWWTQVIETGARTLAISAEAIYAVAGRSYQLSTTGLGGLRGSVVTDPRSGFIFAATDVGLFRFRGAESASSVLARPILHVTIDPTSPGTVFAHAGAVVLRSPDSGMTWSALAGAPTAPFVAPDGRTWYAWAGGLYRSDDAGGTWSRLWAWDVGLPTVNAVAFQGDSLLWASGGDTAKIRAGIFRSDDRGQHFELEGRFPVTSEVLQIPGAVVVPQDVSRTDDFGHTFTPLFPGHPDVKWVAAARVNPRLLLAVDQQFGVRPPALYRTTDAGATWTRCLDGLPLRVLVGQVEFDPADLTVIYVATDSGVYRSSNACR